MSLLKGKQVRLFIFPGAILYRKWSCERLMLMSDYKLTDDGKWVENESTLLFPDYVLDDKGHWVLNESKGN